MTSPDPTSIVAALGVEPTYSGPRSGGPPREVVFLAGPACPQ